MDPTHMVVIRLRKVPIPFLFHQVDFVPLLQLRHHRLVGSGAAAEKRSFSDHLGRPGGGARETKETDEKHPHLRGENYPRTTPRAAAARGPADVPGPAGTLGVLAVITELDKLRTSRGRWRFACALLAAWAAAATLAALNPGQHGAQTANQTQHQERAADLHQKENL